MAELAPDHLNQPLHEEEVMPFLDWLLHDHQGPGETQPEVKRFLIGNPKMTPEQHQVLSQIQDTKISAYRVSIPAPGPEVKGRGAFCGRDLFLSDVALPGKSESGTWSSPEPCPCWII